MHFLRALTENLEISNSEPNMCSWSVSKPALCSMGGEYTMHWVRAHCCLPAISSLRLAFVLPQSPMPLTPSLSLSRFCCAAAAERKHYLSRSVCFHKCVTEVLSLMLVAKHARIRLQQGCNEQQCINNPCQEAKDCGSCCLLILRF